MEKSLDYIIPPIARELIIKELTDERFLRDTNKSGNKLYVVNHHNAPNTVREIGRLREISFTLAGGGTGMEVDIDEFDTSENCYHQLIVWNERDQEIIGGYRFFDCSTLDFSSDNHIDLSTHHYFNFSETFIKDYLPHCIELGRSWIQPKYQPINNPREGIFALDNLWDGLGALSVYHPHCRYFFGKVTMYPNYNFEARDAVLQFMQHYFPDKDKLVWPIEELVPKNDIASMDGMFTDKTFREGMIILNKYTSERGERVPPLIKNYMNLSPTMKSFGTANNPEFGDVEETGILVTLADIYEEKRDRYQKM